MASCLRCRATHADRARACPACGAPLPGAPADLAAPLPAPMTEPVLTPITLERGPHAPLSALSRSFADSGAVANRPRTVVARETLPARPGLPDPPMNDAELHPVHVTIPATDRADREPTETAAPAARPKLVVLRGMKLNAEYPVYEGKNILGRFADKPVDIDLVSQESVEQIWCSRQHAALTLEKGAVLLEDLNSLNGTWLNGVRVHAGQPRPVKPGDVVQVGTVQMKLVMG